MSSKLTSISIIKQKQAKDNKKIARTRRQRGYNWEDTLVKRFNSVDHWKAFRLGSPSIALPDVLAVNTQSSMIFSIEAKSGTSTSLPVPADQIERCQKWITTFDIYKERKVILAFKFLSKKRIGQGLYENRELREFYKIWDESKKITDCVCTYDGEIFAKIDGKRTNLHLEEQTMPFKNKHRTSA
ncbi:resolvase [Nitrosarchaeum sp.]|uniref:resolvase n=1 Tax=Nitrosarchaeum sp. TaxID=2026886 RepID=UPI00247C25DC|nr:resolvase [Nitrosarchaeum sp.]MCV0411517.1 resolvase [Nitrosarchaeum sp.]